MLRQMCREILSEADLKAIARSRGFSAKETASRGIFENYYISNHGLATALAALTIEEIALLHLLKLAAQAVDLTFFERLYGDAKTRATYLTFTQRYQETWKKVQSNLVRKGVLLIAAAPAASIKTKMELWRFRFPTEFEAFLPSPFHALKVSAAAGQSQTDLLRPRLLAVLHAPDKASDLTLADGELRLEGRRFRASALRDWQQANWEAAALKRKKPKSKSEAATASDTVLMPGEKASHVTVAPIFAATYAFSLLQPTEWLAPGELAPLLRIFCPEVKLPPAEEICEAGWAWGGLTQLAEADRTYYRLPSPTSPASEAAPDNYLQLQRDGTVSVDLQTVPYTSLEYLGELADLSPSPDSGKADRPTLLATPNLIKLGRALPALRDTPLAAWLCTNEPSFREAFETMTARWGKHLLHEDLLLAQIKDLGLKMQLQKSWLGQHIVALPNDFIAFPRGWASELEKIVKKAGYVIKTVKADE